MRQVDIKKARMAFSQARFDKAVWDIVSHIAPGQVMSYGEVARAAGFPRHARMVGKALHRSATALPWHRVIRSDRTLAFAVGSEAYRTQQGLLEKEGVQMTDGKVVRPETDDTVDLDKLLWGPSDA
jgi:methylated-DNA-protein-cysteine methyltransferase-like protein